MTSHLESEIYSQPQVIRHLLEHHRVTAQQIAQAIQKFNPTFICIAARGTSDNAARYAQYLFGSQLRLAVALATPSLHTLYESPPILSRALVIGISQSGQSSDVRQVITDARAQGALTVSITNDPGSPLAQQSEYHLPMDAGLEKSVAATKTYTAELAAIAMLAAELSQTENLWPYLLHLPDAMQQTLEMAAPVTQWAERYRYMERFAVIGRGYNYCTAFEISLKIKELCYLAGTEYSEADFRHGPVAMIQPGFPVILAAPQGKTFSMMLDLLQQLRDKQAETIVITNEEAVCTPYAHRVVSIPQVPEWLSPILAVLPGQLFAMNLAMARGHEIDQPRHIQKVTITS